MCLFPLCRRHPDKNGYCLFHSQYAGYSGEVAEEKAIDKKSEKQKKLDREYKKLVKQMLDENNLCEMKTPVCTGIAEGLHHMKRRGVNLMNRKYLKRSCNACNGWAEKNPLKALELGISVKVHTKTES